MKSIPSQPNHVLTRTYPDKSSSAIPTLKANCFAIFKLSLSIVASMAAN